MKRFFCLLHVLMTAATGCLAEETAFGQRVNLFDALIAEDGWAGSWVEWDLDKIRTYADVIGLEGQLLNTAPEGWVTREQAIETAINLILEDNSPVYPQAWYGEKEPLAITEDLIRGLKVAAFPTAGTETNNDLWYVFLYDREWMVQFLDCYTVTLNAHTGEVLSFFCPGGNG